MRYRSFTVRNFKGVNEATISLSEGESSVPITLVGLNESGKTTLLEAIYSFNPDTSSRILFGSGQPLLPDDTAKIPINRLSNFTGKIEIEAVVELNDDDITAAAAAGAAAGWKLDQKTFPRRITVTAEAKYDNSTKTSNHKVWPVEFYTISQRGKAHISTPEQWDLITDTLGGRLPKIAYFPTSVFNFPSKIYLSPKPKHFLNDFYRHVFQDILDAQGENMDIKTHILDRITGDNAGSAFSALFTAFLGSSERSKVQHVIDKVSFTVSNAIVTRWNSLFKHSTATREVIVEYGVEPSEDSESPQVFVEFKIKDGSERYNISSRSLGFRWFFCFLLFTQFRGSRKGTSGTLFLFDEPAANLHAAAQEELLESFLNVANLPNELIYSTHSHHLVNALWLEQAYIIVNESIDYNAEVTGLQTGQTADIKSIPYRQFVNRYPDRTSYFQPVLDRLEVRPSALDLNQDCIILEGKSDYAILRYFAKRSGFDVPLIPAFGATTMGAIIALLRGWGRRFAILLDGDSKGLESMEKYVRNYALSSDEILTLPMVLPGRVEIESLLSKVDRENLTLLMGANITKIGKKSIYNMFQEAISTGKELPLEAETHDRAELLLKNLASRVGKLPENDSDS